MYADSPAMLNRPRVIPRLPSSAAGERGSAACRLGRTVQAMPRFVALLRGIAPSGTNMTNDKLRAVFDLAPGRDMRLIEMKVF